MPIYRNGRLEDVCRTFRYSPVYGDADQINGVFVACTETTRTVMTTNQLRFSEQLSQDLLSNALRFRRAGVSPVIRISNHIFTFSRGCTARANLPERASVWHLREGSIQPRGSHNGH